MARNTEEWLTSQFMTIFQRKTMRTNDTLVSTGSGRLM